ncbi:uncharacterized protein F5Z01DRAFT_662515 [Emericellopsis atlantica]|uniref:Uncharacterized protein n=1 Tax=Emericellopsis atlantica TaxID=2614577 RepID=A0A9P7ZH89_9HYPO|nr:uncharacterized protein F5Z01DRAFT_662515 [Emericellopsis atlantica]KAG9251965.1 hypothetical protein F5Z01DRAFT_662515 [Emericellopsis atlantica]
MPSTRPVTLVHCPLTSLSAIPNPVAHQVVDHFGVDVGSPSNVTRFELQVKPDKKTVQLRTTKGAEQGLYQNARVLLFETNITGETSLSDDEIELIAKRLIQEHGDYRLLWNNCQTWASYLFNEITDVRGHLGLKVSAMVSKPLLSLYSKIF